MKTYTEGNAYEVIQQDITQNFTSYTDKKPEDVKVIVIVGAYWGLEISPLSHYYPNATIYAFEAHPEHFKVLQQRTQHMPNVKIFNYCVSDKAGEIDFYELTAGGTGSIHPFQGDKFGHEFKIKEVLKLPSIRLDSVEELKGKIIDLLWVDVQGAELQVLKGANCNNCDSMFLEVKTREYNKPWDKEPYKGMCYLEELEEYLKNFGIELHSIGLDNENRNGSGNSFWVKKSPLRRVCLIRQPAGLGDIFFCQKIAKQAVELIGCTVLWPIKDSYMYIQDYIKSPDITFVPESSNFLNKHLFTESRPMKTPRFVYLPLQSASTYLGLDSSHIMDAKYELISVDSSDWADFFTFERNIQREEQLFAHVNPNNEPFILVNNKFASPPNEERIDIKLKTNLKIIYMDSLGFDNPFDWCKLMESAEEIHTVNTCFCYLIEKLDVKGKLFMYNRGNYFKDFDYIKGVFKKDWKYI